ncbi:MAG: hypothetical protein DRR03_02175 [Gammaproteobacteria bacterium]|nr:MAG: hypothetical protein DRR03_02175 [Gammaproteobacteria bacterium]
MSAPPHADVAALMHHLFTAPFVIDLGMSLDGFAPAAAKACSNSRRAICSKTLRSRRGGGDHG